MPTVRDLYQHYLEVHAQKQQPRTRKEYERIWERHLLPRFADKELTEVTKLDCIKLFHQLSDTPVEANRTIAIFRAAFNLADQWDLVPETFKNPVRVKLEPEEARDRYPDDEEARRLFTALEETTDQLFAAYIWLLILTGARTTEMLFAKWEFLTPQGIRLPIAKRHKKGRLITLNEQAKTIIDGLKTRDSEYILGPLTDDYPRKTYRLWHKLLASAKVKKLRMMDLRRYFASLALSEGTTLDSVGQLLGHRSTQTTRRYAYLQDDARIQGADSVVAKIERIKKGHS